MSVKSGKPRPLSTLYRCTVTATTALSASAAAAANQIAARLIQC